MHRPRAAIPTGPGFQDHDVIYVYYRLKEAGYDIDVATAGGRPVTGKYGVSVPLDKRAPSCIPYESLAVEDYDLVVLTGGHEAPDRVRQVRTVLDFVAGMDAAGKVVAGLCHGPWIMISARVMSGRRACAYVGMRDDMVNAGAEVIDADVIVDRNMVTCSYYGEVGAFMRAVIELVEAHANESSGDLAIPR